MTAFFELATSGFWTFLGVLILVSVIGRYVVALVLGIVSLARGIPVRYGSSAPSSDEIVRTVRGAMDDGKFDASVFRAVHRNRMRGQA